ncbi:MAG TPA: protein-disulfide reductase DsbD domain-containing protein [Verrucomicrobiae bacterium]|nr:protein-disulfide reductase DsbD domain-containing protein [Verrucomicrobiae bacterium]
MKSRLLLLAALTILAPPAAAAPVAAPHIEAELIGENTAWLPGSTQWVALRLAPEPGWHTYWRNPGDSGLATSLEWTLPEGFAAGEILWPYPSRESLGELTNYGYDRETLHLVPIEVPAKLEVSATLHAKAKWLVCKDICIPGEAPLELTLPVAAIVTTDSAAATRFTEARARLPRAEALAGTFAVAGQELRLEIGDDALAEAQAAEFFPFDNNLVNHGALQRVSLEPGRVRFAQAQSAYFAAMPPFVEGVLVVRGAETKAYTVRALPGEVTTVAAPPMVIPPAAPVSPREAPGLLLVLGFALLGGLILNLMPCVFPVLAIKAVSVLESRRGDPAAERAHALAYTGGVVASCVAAAAMLLAVRSGGEALGWGFQLQSPVFVAFLAYLLLALGLSLSGVVQFGTQLMGVGQGLTEKNGYLGSFFTGVLAVVVASPCTAPFMGVALGTALTAPPLVALLVFATLGLGLALPFLMLGFFPALGKRLPRPGAWMETFKQAMAFPLYFTVAWLLWVLGRQSGIDAVGLALCGLVLASLALWLWGGAARGRSRAALAALATLASLGLLAHPVIRAPAATAKVAEIGQEPWSAARVAELRAQGRVVFVNFTADWCITCKANEKVALGSDKVRAAFAARKVAWLVADWTSADPAITEALAHYGRNGVPLYLLYPPGGGDAVVLPQLLTPDIVLDQLASLPQGD